MFGESKVKQNPFQSQIHSESIKKPNKTMENLSDTHDPSHRVPGIYYWNADPPKKNK
jgi:hypothetical protein